jgi:hypothetical protein
MAFFNQNPMFMKKALTPSFELADSPALTLGNEVIVALTGNTHVPTPQPTLVQLQETVNTYTASLAKSKYGSREDRAQKNADKEALITLLRQECDYINQLAKGDIVILSTCGFPVSKDRQPRVLGTPVATVENSGNGKVVLLTPAVTGSVAYKHQHTADVNVGWSETTTSKAKCTIEDLTPGTMCSFRIIAIGTKGQISISNVVTKMVA